MMEKVLPPSQPKTIVLKSFKNLNRLSQLLFSFSASIINILPGLSPQSNHLVIALVTLYILNMTSILFFQSARKSTHLLTITFQLTIISCLTLAIKNCFLASLFSVFINPAVVLLFTSNISCFVTCTLIQSIFLIFQPPKVQTINDDFTKNLAITGVFLTFLLSMAISDIQKELAQSRSFKRNCTEHRDLLHFLVLEIKNLINGALEAARITAHEESSHKIVNLIQIAKSLGETLVSIIGDYTELGNLPENDFPNTTNMRELFEQLWRIAGENFKRSNTKGHIKIQTQVPAILKFNSRCFTYAFLDILCNNNSPVKILVEWVGEPLQNHMTNQYPNESFSLLQVTCERRIQDPYIILSHNDKEIKTKFGSNETGFDSKGILRVIFQDLVTMEYNNNTLKHKILEKVCPGVKFVNNHKTAIIEFPCIVVTAREQLKVIIADEDHESADLLADYVQKMQGIIKGKMRNGLEAYMSFVKSAKEKEYIDAVILDLNLPIIEGGFLCKKIRAYEKEHNLVPCRIVIVAKELNYNDLSVLTDHNGEYKAQCFLKKPVTFEKLKGCLKE